MRKFTVCKCPECGMRFKTIGGWSSHIEKRHPDLIPSGFTYLQYFYYLQTGKDKGKCIVCDKETKWNENMGKYDRYCSNPKCKEQYREMFKKRMIGRYQKVHLLDDPDQQKKMLANRKISGTYTFSDNTKVSYVGTYEKDFLAMLDNFMHLSGKDIMAPSPHTYYYIYEGKKHFYIPDFYLPTWNLEVEIKTHENTHHKFIEVDRIKEEEKDKVMHSLKDINYLKIVDKDYSTLFEFLLSLKESISEEDIREMKQNAPKETSALENTLDISDYESFTDVLDTIYDGEKDIDESIVTESAIIPAYDFCHKKEDIALEGAVDDFMKNSSNVVFSKSKWRSIFFTPNMLKKSISPYVKVKYDPNKHEYTIWGINFRKLKLRIGRVYGDRKIEGIYIKEFNQTDYAKYEQKMISKDQMRIKSIHVPEFFILEFLIMMRELYARYRDVAYLTAMKRVYVDSWMATADKMVPPELDLTPLKNMTYQLFDYQKDFIRNFNRLKYGLHLNGYILAFGQGLGKTLTAIGLTECLYKKHIFIVCPNTLRNNWADEIKQYFQRYIDNEALWHDEVFAMNTGNTISPNTKYIIVNNESISKIFEYTKNLDPKECMVIVDECHNFRNYQGLRTSELVELHSRLGKCDVLLCSGTPIKALPSEITPALMLLDSTFDINVAKMYYHTFKSQTTINTKSLQTRLGNIIYRRTEGPKLPEKYQETISVRLPNEGDYLLKNVSKLITDLFHQEWEKEYAHNQEYLKAFLELLDKKCTAPREIRARYEELAVEGLNESGGTAYMGLHEVDIKFVQSFMQEYVYCNITNPVELKKAKLTHKNYIMMRQHCIGVAIGNILPKYRTNMFIDIYKAYSDKMIRMIQNNEKKTIIFSMMLNVVNYIYEDLNKRGINTVKVIGGHPQENQKAIEQFKMNDDVDVIIATSQTMATGLTLTEASLMFFFGTPWRSTDYDQCCDRMYRIGQTSDVYIYNMLMESELPNLSTRIENILEWSNNLFNAQLNTDDIVSAKLYEVKSNM